MPWQCGACRTAIEQDVLACPSCGSPKTAWTMLAGKTRRFVLQGKQVTVLRIAGDGDLDPAPDGGVVAREDLEPATEAPVVGKATLRARLAEGGRPRARDGLVVRLVPRAHPDLDVHLAIAWGSGEVEDRVLPGARPAGLVGDQPLDVLLVLVHGDGPADDLLVHGVHVVDITEATAAGFAPGIEVAALGRPPRALPTVAEGDFHLSARFLDRSGTTPVADREVVVEGGPTARTDAEGRVHVPGRPMGFVRCAVDGEAALVPAVHDPRIVVTVRLPGVEPAPPVALTREEARREDERASWDGRPHEVYAPPALAESTGDDDAAHAPPAGHDFVLSARFLDRDGLRPVADRPVVVHGPRIEDVDETRTDEDGRVLLRGWEPCILSVTVDEHEPVPVPTVHDPAIVVAVRLRELALEPEEPAERKDPAEPAPADEAQDEEQPWEARPAHVYAPPALDEATDAGEAGPDGDPPDGQEFVLSARFLDRDGRRPVADRPVVVHGPRIEDVDETRTDEDGRVLLRGWGHDDLLSVVVDDHEPVTVPAVHDPAIVVAVRLRDLVLEDPAARPARDDEAQDWDGRPSHVYAPASGLDEGEAGEEPEPVVAGHAPAPPVEDRPHLRPEEE